MLKNLCFFNSYFLTCYHFTISLTWTDSITSAGSVALYWPNSMKRFMSRICYVLIAHIMYLFYSYSSSYNLFINWGQTGDRTGDRTGDTTCDAIFWREHTQQFLYLVFCYHLTSSSSFLQGIAKTSFDSAIASFVSWLISLDWILLVSPTPAQALQAHLQLLWELQGLAGWCWWPTWKL